LTYRVEESKGLLHTILIQTAKRTEKRKGHTTLIQYLTIFAQAYQAPMLAGVLVGREVGRRRHVVVHHKIVELETPARLGPVIVNGLHR